MTKNKTNKMLFGISLGTDTISFLFLVGVLIAIFMGKVDIEFTLNIPVTIISLGLITSGKSIISNIAKLTRGVT